MTRVEGSVHQERRGCLYMNDVGRITIMKENREGFDYARMLLHALCIAMRFACNVG